RQSSVDRTIVISPSPEFVSGLPNGKIPDRHDFEKFPPAERERAWREAVSACRALADDLEDVLDNGRMAERLKPFD
ncbi:MAG: patatin-like phospholipase family protein, partial [Pseudomonadota bacterium]